jgi:hypothetical protein
MKCAVEIVSGIQKIIVGDSQPHKYTDTQAYREHVHRISLFQESRLIL